jgi:thiamine biosynthesis lipoprotein
MIRKILVWVLTAVLLTGCGTAPMSGPEQKRYQASFLTLFDTVTSIVGYAETEEEFKSITDEIHDQLELYHQLFDIYNDYEGINNIKTINDQAGTAPVKVDPIIIDFLLDCKEYYELSGGRVNVAMGSVLYLWHETRNEGIDNPEHAKLPDGAQLKAAAEHCSMETVLIDEDASTVYLEDPDQRLDVGAIAKGWSTQRVCENAPSGLLVSVGGNVCATGPKPEKNSSWVVGIQSPNGKADEYLHTVYVNQESVVTSGDYQRYYTVDGKKYHHIIDPDTLYPSDKWKSVSIICTDSGLGDALSTALFLLDLEEGQKLLDKYDAHAVWVDLEGKTYYSPGFKELIRT